MNKFIKTTLNEYLNTDIIPNTYSVYHSSDMLFKKFDISKITNLRGDLYGGGFYFTNNVDYSKKFGKYTYKCLITLNNPLILTIPKKANTQLTELLNLIADISESNYERIKDNINYQSYTTAFRDIRKYLSFNDIRNIFDGVIGYCEEGGKEYVVYNPSDIEILDVE